MNCEQASLLFEQALAEPNGVERRRVTQHLSTCAECRHAFGALACLRAEQDRPVPDPSPGALEDALRAAAASGWRRAAGSFWSGMAVGALAAGVAAVALLFLLEARIAPRELPPEITLALHQPGDLRIAIDAPQALSSAEIHVRLSGAVDLEGFPGERDIRWTTHLERGVNELRLPVTATGAQGGQVQVVVRHGERQKTFTVDVHVATGAGPVEPAARSRV